MAPVKYVRFPSVPQGIPVWATYVATRNPCFKIHDRIGTAKSAITTNGHGILYRHMLGRDGDLTWTPVAVVHEGEAKTHPYRKRKPEQLTERVVLFTIQEVPV